MDYFAPEDQAKKYAYRCHRATVDGQDVVYPINALAYHPLYIHYPSLFASHTINHRLTFPLRFPFSSGTTRSALEDPTQPSRFGTRSPRSA